MTKKEKEIKDRAYRKGHDAGVLLALRTNNIEIPLGEAIIINALDKRYKIQREDDI